MASSAKVVALAFDFKPLGSGALNPRRRKYTVTPRDGVGSAITPDRIMMLSD